MTNLNGKSVKISANAAWAAPVFCLVGGIAIGMALQGIIIPFGSPFWVLFVLASLVGFTLLLLYAVKALFEDEKVETVDLGEPMLKVATNVMAERRRQIKAESPLLASSDEQFMAAAACYVAHASARHWKYQESLANYQAAPAPEGWPWGAQQWKPTDPRQDLVTAAALTMAAVEQKDRGRTGHEQSAKDSEFLS